MAENDQFEVILGRISGHLKVDEFTVRNVQDHRASNTEENLPEWVVQGHVTNKTNVNLDDVTFDMSYYHAGGGFLGLDKSGMLDVDEIEPHGSIPFSLDLDIPDGTSKCVLNVGAKKMAGGLIMRWLYKGKG